MSSVKWYQVSTKIVRQSQMVMWHLTYLSLPVIVQTIGVSAFALLTGRDTPKGMWKYHSQCSLAQNLSHMLSVSMSLVVTLYINMLDRWILIERIDWNNLWFYHDQEPSGRMFNNLCLDYNNKPHNPLLNSGAIMSVLLQKILLKLKSCINLIFLRKIFYTKIMFPVSFYYFWFAQKWRLYMIIINCIFGKTE